MRTPILFSLLGSAALTLAIVHYAAFEFYLYYEYLWFDIPMHFLGGVVIGLLFFVIPLFVALTDTFVSFKNALIFVLLIGIVWEIFEVACGISTWQEGFVADTSLDMVMDLLGGAVGYYVGIKTKTLERI